MQKTNQPSARRPKPANGSAAIRPSDSAERDLARKPIGLRDVARVAGVSTATVSRAINNPEIVSEELRARISSVIQHLGWVPDGAARALATRRTGAVGAVFPTLTHGDFARAIHVLQSELTERGHTLLLACSEYDPDQEFQQVRKLIERGVDALVLVGEAHHSELMDFIALRNVPFVNTFVYSPGSHGTCIGPDNHKAVYRLTNHLADLGHRRFGVIAQSTANNDRTLARLQGIRDALAERSIAIQPAHFAEGYWTIGEGRELFRRIVSHSPMPTAVICGNAFLAIGAMLESQALGLRVPDQISIVGYDDIEMMRELPIPLTTIRVSSEEVGRRAARFLLARIEGKELDMPFECEAELIVRASSGPPPAV